MPKTGTPSPPKQPAKVGTPIWPREERKQRNKEARAARKEVQKLESKIVKLDDERKALNDQLMKLTDPVEAQKVHAKFTEVADEIAELEGKWLEFQEQLEDFDGD